MLKAAKEVLAKNAKLAKEDSRCSTLTRRYACDLSLKGEVDTERRERRERER
jgi:hypothetical protein